CLAQKCRAALAREPGMKGNCDMTSIHQRPPYHNKFRIRRPPIERERDGVWLEHLGHCSHCDFMAIPRAHRVPSPREDAPRARVMTRDYSVLMRQVASLLGYDPRLADRRGLARYRSRDSLKIDFARGTFTDFEAGVGGGVLDFIQHASG